MRILLVLVVVVLVLVAAGWLLLQSPAGRDGREDPLEDAGPGAGGQDVPDAIGLAGRGQEDRDDAPRSPEVEAPAAPGPGRVLVEVRTIDGDQPIAGARFVLVDAEGQRFEAVTDLSGNASIEGLAVGAVEGHAEAAGFAVSEREVGALEAGESATISFMLDRGTPIRGAVRRAEDGAPIAGARVTAMEGGDLGNIHCSSGREPFETVVTDAEGAFLFPGLPFDLICTIVAHAPGHRTTRKCFIWHETETERSPAVIELEPGGRLIGRVRARDGAPVPGATVEVHPAPTNRVDARLDAEAGPPMLRAVADAEGRFVVDGLAFGGLYGAFAAAPGHASSEWTWNLLPTVEASEVVADFVLRSFGGLVVDVPDADGGPVRDVTFTWWDREIEPARHHGTDEGRRYVFGSLDPGPGTLRVAVPGFLVVSQEIDVPEGEATEVTVRLERGLSIAGVVVDENGQPVAGMQVMAGSEGAGRWPVARALTDAQGRFRLRGLEPVDHSLEGWGDVSRVERVDGVRAPASGVRLVAARAGRVTFHLVLPPGTKRPDEVWLGSRGGGSGTQRTRPWASGTFQLRVRARGSIIHVEGRGFAPFLHEVAVAPGETRDLGSFELTRGVELVGRALDPVGRPVPGVALDVAGHAYGQASTGADGRFRIPFLRPGELQVDVLAEGFLPRRIELEAEADPPPLRIRLARGGLLRGRVTREGGTPAVGLEVDVLPPGDEVERDGYRLDGGDVTDARGSFEIRLPAGPYVIRISKWEGDEQVELATGEAVLREGETTEVELPLPAPR